MLYFGNGNHAVRKWVYLHAEEVSNNPLSSGVIACLYTRSSCQWGGCAGLPFSRNFCSPNLATRFLQYSFFLLYLRAAWNPDALSALCFNDFHAKWYCCNLHFCFLFSFLFISRQVLEGLLRCSGVIRETPFMGLLRYDDSFFILMHHARRLSRLYD